MAMLIRSLFVIGIFLIALSAPALGAERVALLIGNQSYARAVGALKNPINDVNLIAGSLRKIGFKDKDIRIVKDATRRDVLRAVDSYASKLRSAGGDAIGFLYYSGHGVANVQNKRNYLIPVDVKRLDANVWYDAIRLDQIVTTLQDTASNAAHFVVFDACRNALNTSTKGSKGFVPVVTRRGMLIAFSTDPGQTASDEGNGGGPYASALAAELIKPGLDHLDLFQNVKEAVVAKISGQVPWERNGLVQRVYLAGRTPASAQRSTSQPEPNEAARAFQIAKNTKSPAALRAFSRRYKGTVLADMASAMADTIDKQRLASVAQPKPQPPAPVTQDRVVVRIPPGQTSFAIMRRLSSRFKWNMDSISIPDEGTLLPEIYVLKPERTAKEVVDRMQTTQTTVANRLWQNRLPGLPFNSLQKALTLASIVEKEAGRWGDKKRIAGVFVNRLKRGMKLQSDATVRYGVSGPRVDWSSKLLRSDIARKTPYNTYQIVGLPPAPICNPSRDSIRAVLRPANTKELYFVSNGSNGHAFASTLKQHQRNVRRWLRSSKERER